MDKFKEKCLPLQSQNTAFFRPKWLELRSPIVQSKPYFPIRPARPMGFFVPSSVIWSFLHSYLFN